jgi:hypothetical protein
MRRVSDEYEAGLFRALTSGKSDGDRLARLEFLHGEYAARLHRLGGRPNSLADNLSTAAYVAQTDPERVRRLVGEEPPDFDIIMPLIRLARSPEEDESAQVAAPAKDHESGQQSVSSPPPKPYSESENSQEARRHKQIIWATFAAAVLGSLIAFGLSKI